MEYGGCFDMHYLLDLQVGESRRAKAEKGHRWEEDAKGIATVELKDKSEPVFWIVGDHSGESIRSHRFAGNRGVVWSGGKRQESH